ncbi:hypothetical protein BCAR13_60170 [Paraburkholderia caribensis]|nr:hypothetical protein BCAR13_60170 [Paraburkholderia caribensis]
MRARTYAGGGASSFISISCYTEWLPRTKMRVTVSSRRAYLTCMKFNFFMRFDVIDVSKLTRYSRKCYSSETVLAHPFRFR